MGIPPAVTWCSCIASSSAAWVLGGVRLISSARMTLAKTGPLTKRISRWPVVLFSSMTSVPVMSLGMRSGVNWIRLNWSERVCATVETSSVLARPGTPTSRPCPRVNRHMNSCSMTSSWPTTILATWFLSPAAAWLTSCTSSIDASGVGLGSDMRGPFTEGETTGEYSPGPACPAGPWGRAYHWAMPELPEVECVRLSLERRLLGRRVVSVRVNRSDIVRGDASPNALLRGDTVARVLRHGKQLAVVGDSGGCLCVHLGMSGQLCFVHPADATGTRLQAMKRTDTRRGSTDPHLPPHTHLVWRLDDGTGMRFTDPRRFGGVWVFEDLAALQASRWSALGQDALHATPVKLHHALAATKRGLKAALLDQSLIAGLGNIYVDELLFAAQLHPLQPAPTLTRRRVEGLTRRMRTLLAGAVERGGSSLRDYVDADNQQGSQQARHRVYGRAGQRCKRRGCRARIASAQVAGRTTAWCPGCQQIAG